MDSIGYTDQSGVYHLNPEHEGQLTHVYIDNTNFLLSESDGFSMMNEEALQKKLSSYISELRAKYNVNFTIIKPSKFTMSRIIKDSEPNYKDMGAFYDSSDIGLVIYNPYNENNNSYLGYPVNDLVIRGKSRFRSITVVRNYSGIENVTVGMIFLGECGYIRESPHPNDNEGFDDFIEILKDLP